MPVQDPADRLDARMRRLGLSQAELGRQAGISGQNIGKVLNRRIGLTVEMARKLAPYLGVSVAWLLGEEEAPARTAEPEVPVHIVEMGRWLDQLDPDIRQFIYMIGTVMSLPNARKRIDELVENIRQATRAEARSTSPAKRASVVPIRKGGRRRKARAKD